MNVLERSWYQTKWYRHPLSWCLLPLSWLFAGVSKFRRFAYRQGWLKSESLPVPVIVVGNISVGGNGKTPLVIKLADWLRQAGYQPGVVSRGYGGNGQTYPQTVSKDSDPAEVGDEPVLMRQHLACPLVVDPVRPRGAKYLIDKHKCDVILCDDGLQHYALERDIEIVVVDGQRRHGNQCLLPVGPLREPLSRLELVDFVVCNGGDIHSHEHLMTLEPGSLVNVKYPGQTKTLKSLQKPVTAIAAIGNPERFFNLLRQKQVKLKQCLSFADHYAFNENDIPRETVLMTEKDAVKCRRFAHDDWWFLPVTATLSEQFKQQLFAKLNTIKNK